MKMKGYWRLIGLITLLLVSLTGAATGLPAADFQSTVNLEQTGDLPAPKAHNIILLIGDGMGPHHVTAARYKAVGPAGSLNMDLMPVAGFTHTYASNALVTDSAAAGTSIASGVKTYNGAIGVDADGNAVETILEQAQALGKATGLVSTVQLAHATPAAFAAHVSSRGMMTEIAKQMFDHQVDVLLGGGEDEWLPEEEDGCYPEPGERTDDLDLTLSAVTSGYAYVCNQADFDEIDPASTPKLLGLFADEGMTRPYQPSLVAMTQKAIDILSRDPDGFFLMVEAGQIDWASHGNDAVNTIEDTIEFDEAVAVARTFAASNPDTLVIATSDHETGGLSIEKANDGSSSFQTPDDASFDVAWTSGTHTAVDVPLFAQGPHAQALSGSYENTHIFDVMSAAFQSPLCRTLGDMNRDGEVNVVDIEWVAAGWQRACSSK